MSSISDQDSRKLFDLKAKGAAAFDDTTVLPSVKTSEQVAFYVYEAPVRAWHWINALAILVLCVTGYLIGAPPPSLSGEASNHFLFGYIRFTHFAAGQILIVAFLARIIWAFLGNRVAREIFVVPVWNIKWWRELWQEAKWYLFLSDKTVKYVGHNPLAQIAMFVFLVLPMIVMIFTGLALYAEGLGASHPAYWFTEIGHLVFGTSMALHTFHHLGMWVLICFVILHLYVAIRKDIMSGSTYISTIVNGWRVINIFKK